MYDLHVHTCFSRDSETQPAAYLQRAKALGLDGVCFTDHFDYEFPYGIEFDIDFDARNAFLDALPPVPGVAFTRGIELGLRREAHIIEINHSVVMAQRPDFVLGSVHVVEDSDPYFPAYFDGRTRAEGYKRYLEEVLACITLCDDFHVLSHFDYPAKGCPYDENDVRLSDAPEVIDAIFRLLIERGQSFEINTSSMRKYKDPLPNGDILRRFVELGGEWITIGSDAHLPEQLGYRFDDARELARCAGIRYTAHFNGGKPVLTPIG